MRSPESIIRRSFEGLILAALLVVSTAPNDAGAQDRIVVLPAESRILIEGTSNVNSFTCEAAAVSGFGLLADNSGSDDVKGEVEIPVQAFDCENRRMSRDLFEALKGERHPAIRYRLDGVRIVDENPENGAALLEAEGTLWVAGTGRSIRTRVMGDRLANGYLRATGALDFSMSDFGIDPPTAMLGLVRVRDDVTVRFEITATHDSNVTGGSGLQNLTNLGEVRR